MHAPTIATCYQINFATYDNLISLFQICITLLVADYRWTMSSHDRCQIAHCRRGGPFATIPSARFDATRRDEWLIYCRPAAVNLKRGYVCFHHFSSAQQVKVGDQMLLKRGAVPDQHLPR